MHWLAWRTRVWAWVRALLRRWWILVILGLYKIAEDRILGEINDQLEGREGWLADASRRVIDVVPYFVLWLLIPATLIYLLWRAYVDSKPISFPTAAPGIAPKTKRVILEHDGMEWEYAGRRTDPMGPFCPGDHTPLAFVDARNGGPGPNIVPFFRHDNAHMGGYWGYLRCLTCQEEYGKDDVESFKTVEQSQNEVRRKFEGMENRGEV